MEANPLRFFTQGLVDRIAHTRRHLAAFLGADPDGTALVGNTTTGVAVCSSRCGLRPGDEVLQHRPRVRRGEPRHPARVPPHRRGQPGRCRCRWPPPTSEIVQTVRAGLRPGRTRLLDRRPAHLGRPPGSSRSPRSSRWPANTACRSWSTPRTRPGMLPTAGGQHRRRLLGRQPAQVGVRPARHRRCWRWRRSGGTGSSRWWSPGSRSRVSRPGVEWQATLDYTPWLAAPAGLFTLRSLGVDRVRAHNAALAAYGQRVVGDALGVAPADLPDPGGPAVAMRLIPLPAGAGHHDRRGAGAADADRRAARRRGRGDDAWNGRGWLRLSRPGLQHRRRVRTAGRTAAGAARPALTGGARPADRQQAHRAEAEQGQRVEVFRRPGAAPSAGRPRPGSPGARAAARPAARRRRPAGRGVRRVGPARRWSAARRRGPR